MSDGENIDPREQNGGQSETSSQPSEYPSTDRAWPDDGGRDSTSTRTLSFDSSSGASHNIFFIYIHIMVDAYDGWAGVC